VSRPRERRSGVAPDSVGAHGGYSLEEGARPSDHGRQPAAGDSPWQRLDRRVAYENLWLTVWHDEVIRPDGAPGIYGVVHFANRAIGVLAIDERDRVLLVGQHRYPLDAYSWEIPEGGGGPDESEIDAARRELAEETGYRAATWRELGRAALSNSVTDELAVFFVATDLEGGAASPEGTEELQTRWVTFDEALAMTLDGRISDALTMLAVQREALERRR
jgi:8-oxo-dGTP pyrophosphatase MutT (NUDIX family)